MGYHRGWGAARSRGGQTQCTIVVGGDGGGGGPGPESIYVRVKVDRARVFVLTEDLPPAAVFLRGYEEAGPQRAQLSGLFSRHRYKGKVGGKWCSAFDILRPVVCAAV